GPSPTASPADPCPESGRHRFLRPDGGATPPRTCENPLISFPIRGFPLVELAGGLSKLAPALARMGSMHWSIRGRRPQPRPLEPRARKLPRVSEEMLVRAEARYAAGATLREIAKELGLGRERLASLLRTRGVRLRRATPSDKEVREMVRRYESGESLDRV